MADVKILSKTKIETEWVSFYTLLEKFMLTLQKALLFCIYGSFLPYFGQFPTVRQKAYEKRMKGNHAKSEWSDCRLLTKFRCQELFTVQNVWQPHQWDTKKV